MSDKAIKNLVIVESPAKAKTIEKFLDASFIVKSCYGHIRDLSKGDNAIDIKNGFQPNYEVSDDKKVLVAELRRLSKNADTVWLASDEDREGEAISWHLFETLGLSEEKTKRIVFHEITKTAILNAIANPRMIDYNLVNAQQARRVLDRLVGFELSPVLWKKVRPSLSAGRVQSVATRIVVEREREINQFGANPYYQVKGDFNTNIDGKDYNFVAKNPKAVDNENEVIKFFEKCKNGDFFVNDLEVKPTKRYPTAPFTTSTLQQEASRKLGFSITQTMLVAQKLYEAGYITYMRTDSVNLSTLAIDSAKTTIVKDYGPSYSSPKNYVTKSDSAQEAHEAIRPTDFNRKSLNSDSQENRLYELIWKKAISSQMSPANIERTIITVQNSNSDERLLTIGEVIKYDGFLKVYLDSKDDDEAEDEDSENKLLPPVKVGEKLNLNKLTATQKYTRPPARYTEASLVKKLEQLGIGRPSTYAPTIATIQKRGYVVKEDREGTTRNYKVIAMINNNITQAMETENVGREKSKLFPTDIGMLVNDFLVDHFETILDYSFTANVENEFDEIAKGKIEWNQMIQEFYTPFHLTVERTSKEADRVVGNRILGTDPKTGKPVSVRLGKYGPLAQIGDNEDEDKKYASLRAGMSIESVTLEQALSVFGLPRAIGEFEGKEIKASIGRFGPYLSHNSAFYSLEKTDDPYTVELERAIDLIELGRKKLAEKKLKIFDNNPELQILKGRWGPYLYYKKENYKLPKDAVIEDLTEDDCLKIVVDFLAANPGKARQIALNEEKTEKERAKLEKKAKAGTKSIKVGAKTGVKGSATTPKKKVVEEPTRPRFIIRKKGDRK
jgi:DNA topoisomerase-1